MRGRRSGRSKGRKGRTLTRKGRVRTGRKAITNHRGTKKRTSGLRKKRTTNQRTRKQWNRKNRTSRKIGGGLVDIKRNLEQINEVYGDNRVLIIGGGPVGLFIAYYILSTREDYHVTLVDKRYAVTRDAVVIIQNNILSETIPGGVSNNSSYLINDILLEQIILHGCHHYSKPWTLRTANDILRSDMGNDDYDNLINKIGNVDKPYTGDQTSCRTPDQKEEMYRRGEVPGGLSLPINILQDILIRLLATYFGDGDAPRWIQLDLGVDATYSEYLKLLKDLNYKIIMPCIGIINENFRNMRSSGRTSKEEFTSLQTLIDINYYMEDVINDRHYVHMSDSPEDLHYGYICQVVLRDGSVYGNEIDNMMVVDGDGDKSMGCAGEDICSHFTDQNHSFIQSIDKINTQYQNQIRLFPKRSYNIEDNEKLALGLVLTNPKMNINDLEFAFFSALNRFGISSNDIISFHKVQQWGWRGDQINGFPIHKYTPDIEKLPYRVGESQVFPIGDMLYPHHFFTGAGIGRGMVMAANSFEICSGKPKDNYLDRIQSIIAEADESTKEISRRDSPDTYLVSDRNESLVIPTRKNLITGSRGENIGFEY